jgi:hypothetical protein
MGLVPRLYQEYEVWERRGQWYRCPV